MFDDTGREVRVTRQVQRVVSLVPSLTEAVAVTAPGLLAGATDWCTHPASLDVVRVRGTKNPDVAAVVALEPDLVLANAEENRAADLEALRGAGIAVWVTDVRTVPGALESLGRLMDACRLGRPAWLDAAEAAWAVPWTSLTSPASSTSPAERRRAFVPIWRKPWMALGRDTFAGDVLARLGVDHVYADDTERYPRVRLDDARARGLDLVVCPDEPYAFSPAQDLDCFAGFEVPVAFVSGRHLTWYGPSMVEAPRLLADQLAAGIPAPPR